MADEHMKFGLAVFDANGKQTEKIGDDLPERATLKYPGAQSVSIKVSPEKY